MDASSLSTSSYNRSNARIPQLAAVACCFFLSGFAGLLYETVWFRQFATVFGTSEAALGAVLSAYMGGLALGAWVAARWENRIKCPVLAYGLLELGVAVGACLVPYGLWLADGIRYAVCGGQAELPAASGFLEVGLDSVLAFALILIPTTCMGATLPLLARHAEGGRLDSDENNGEGNSSGASSIGLLYGINTLGAVVGTLAAAFVILPALGLWATTLVGAGINLAVFAVAAWLQRSVAGSALTELDVASTATSVDLGPSALTGVTDSKTFAGLLPLMVGIASAASFTYEVLWTRLLGQVLGGSLHSFSTMLAAFLTGIAIGSCVASRIIARGGSAIWSFALAQAFTAIATVVAFSGVDFVPLLSSWTGAGLAGGLLANVGICLFVLLPSTVAIGMSLPLAIQMASERGRTLATTTGRLYAASTLGAIVGAMIAGHLLLPVLGFRGTVLVAVAANLVVAAWGFLQAQPVRKLHYAGVGVPVAVCCLLFVGGPDLILRYMPLANDTFDAEVVYAEVGESSTVMLTQNASGFHLFTNGLPESEIAPRGSTSGAEAGARWLTVLPVLARPDTESMLIIGFGGGSAVCGVPQTVKSIDTIELEPKVVEAVRTVAAKRESDPLSDPRLNIVYNDARGALSLTTKQYDAIVSQPSHPWSAGASHLYTREFLELVRGRLSENGVFLQWMNSRYVDRELLRSLGATLLSSFKTVRVYQPSNGVLLFLASDGSLNVEEHMVQTGLPFRRGLRQLRWLGLNTVHDVVATLAAEHEGLQAFCEGAEIITDNRNQLAMRAGGLIGKALANESEVVFAEVDPLVTRDNVPSILTRLNIEPARVVRSLAQMKMLRRVKAMVETVPDAGQRSLSEAFLAAYTGQSNDARKMFQDVLTERPTSSEARFKLIEMDLPQVALGQGGAGAIRLVSTASSAETAIVRAAAAYYRQDWPELQLLDGQLGTARDGDLCQPLALTFRALWRSKAITPQRREAYCREAIEFTDRALAIDPTVFAGLVRLWAAENSGSVETWLESAYFLVLLFNSQPYAVSAETADKVSRQVLSRLAELQPENSWQVLRIDSLKDLYTQVRDQALAAD